MGGLAARTMLPGHDVPSWSTLAVAILCLSGIQVMPIGVMGEYLARAFRDVKGQPGYLIADDFSIRPSSEC